MIKGDAIEHAEDSSDFTITETGVYSVAFNGVIAPAAGETFPLGLVLYLEQNGSSVNGASTQHTFHTSTETINQAFTAPIEVTTVPTTLRIIGSGGNITYSTTSVTIYKIGENTP